MTKAIVATLTICAIGAVAFLIFDGQHVYTKADAKRTACLANLHAVGKALQLYEADNSWRLPPGNSWCDAIEKYVGDRTTFRCPEMLDEPYAYMINKNYAGWATDTGVRAELNILCFDGFGGKNLEGSLYSVQYRHEGRTTLLFLDGHIKAATKEEAARFAWDPPRRL